MRWANNPDESEPVSILEAYPQVTPHGWLPTLQTHLRASPKTRTGYFATVTSCVGFMDSPTVGAACRPGPGGAFNVEAFLRWRGTLYLVGGAGDKRVAPLLTGRADVLPPPDDRLHRRGGGAGGPQPGRRRWIVDVAAQQAG